MAETPAPAEVIQTPESSIAKADMAYAINSILGKTIHFETLSQDELKQLLEILSSPQALLELSIKQTRDAFRTEVLEKSISDLITDRPYLTRLQKEGGLIGSIANVLLGESKGTTLRVLTPPPPE